VNEDVIAARNAVKEQTKELPTKMQAEEEQDFDAIETLDALTAETKGVMDLFGYVPGDPQQGTSGRFEGPLQLGIAASAVGSLGLVGLGGEETTDLANARQRFNEFKTRMVNQSLRLNKGVQTEGDAIRAARELQTAYDEATAYAALQNLLRINEQARRLKIQAITNRRARYGVTTDVTIPEPVEVPQLNWKIVK